MLKMVEQGRIVKLIIDAAGIRISLQKCDDQRFLNVCVITPLQEIGYRSFCEHDLILLISAFEYVLMHWPKRYGAFKEQVINYCNNHQDEERNLFPAIFNRIEQENDYGN